MSYCPSLFFPPSLRLQLPRFLFSLTGKTPSLSSPLVSGPTDFLRSVLRHPDCGVCTGRILTYSNNPVARANDKKGWCHLPAPPPWQPTGKRDKLAIQIIGLLPASSPNKKAGIAAEVQRVFVAYSGGEDPSSSSSYLFSADRKGKDGGCLLWHLEADRQSEFWWVHEGFG